MTTLIAYLIPIVVLVWVYRYTVKEVGKENGPIIVVLMIVTAMFVCGLARNYERTQIIDLIESSYMLDEDAVSQLVWEIDNMNVDEYDDNY